MNRLFHGGTNTIVRKTAMPAMLRIIFCFVLVSGMCCPSPLAIAYANEGALSQPSVSEESIGGASDDGGVDEGDGQGQGDSEEQGGEGGSDGEGEVQGDGEEGQDAEGQLCSAALYYKDASMEEFAVFQGTAITPLSINSRCGSISFDVLLTYDDETTCFASDANVLVDWTFTNESSSKICRIDAEDGYGVVSALGEGNGTARLHAALHDYPDIMVSPHTKPTSNVMIGVQGNDAQVLPRAMTVQYKDWISFFSWKTVDDDDPPTIVLRNGRDTEVSLMAQTIWSDGSKRDIGQDSYSCRWSIDSCTDLDGEDCPTFAWVSDDGVVTADGRSDGFVYVRCEASSPDYSDLPFSSIVKIAVRNNLKYVTSLKIVSSGFEEYGSGFVLEDGINQEQLYAKVVYACYDVDTQRQYELTTYSAFDDIPGLSWAVFRGDTSEEEQYSTITQDGLFAALSGFSQARVEVRIDNGGYFGQSVSNSLRVTRQINEEDIGKSNSIRVKIYHISDYDKLGDAAPVAREEDITRDQLVSLGGAYSDWSTYRKKSDSWGTIYANGISISAFLGLLGIDSSDLEFIEFCGSDGYGATQGFYSADAILSTQYRYSNYYMHKVSSSSSYLGQSSVAPMLALSFYMDPGNDYIGSGFSKMTSNSTIRLVLGMEGVDGRNAAKSVSCVSDVIIVIADQPDEEDGGGGGDGGGGKAGQGVDAGGGSGSDPGEAAYGSDGGAGSSGASENSTLGDKGSGSILRELLEQSQQIIERATLDNPYTIPALFFGLLVAVFGAYRTNKRWNEDLFDGERMRCES